MMAHGGTILTKETFAGSDLTGSDGNANRVLTLSNTKMSSTVRVSIGVSLKEDTDYTVSHQTTGTTITFLGKVWDNQQGEVIYE